MQRREFLRVAGVTASGGSLAGCPGRNGDFGVVSVGVRSSADAVSAFETCVVTLTELRVLSSQRATETEDHEGAELLFSVGDATVDLVAAADESVPALVEQELITDQYVYLKLVVSNVSATLADGQSAVVQPPDDGTLKFVRPFEVRTDETTTITTEMALDQRGTTARYALQPSPSRTAVSYE